MHPMFHEDLRRERRRELDRQLQHAWMRRERELARMEPQQPVLLRLARVGDDADLADLATLAGVRPTPGQYVVAEIEGRLVAAQALAGGEPMCDPFKPTAHLIPLLRLRADQVTGTRPLRSSLRGVFAALRSARA